ncbi:uncharacterized protein LOC121978716 [Zingiber officinale]|uniref:uncharacterized protein LOC121978716 n=1 Tax=Zingiber officinale TaxID=94328 RepID=UPI001C4DC09D|nr:uncharacterized protein LOC121978716 [Zingiber officinale]
MNISTILTSIRLLLSEPNPDDALMAEIVPLEAHGALVPDSRKSRPREGQDEKETSPIIYKLTTTPVMPSGMNDNAEKEVIVLNNEILDMPAKQSGSMRRKLC